jgi:hypothetical protein
MPTPIRITGGDMQVRAELNDTPCAQAIADALPIQASAQTWGQEVYFEIPVRRDLENGCRSRMAVGELGYWPPGQAFCIFFGRTPASASDQPVAAGDVNVLGRITRGIAGLHAVRDGQAIRLERAD